MADRILQSIIDGERPPGSSLPPEGMLATQFEVSRVTIREAIRILRARNVVEIRRGRGTEVRPPEAWSSLEAIVRASLPVGGPGVVAKKVLEARRMIEVGAAQLAATRRTEKHLLALYDRLEAMRAAEQSGDFVALADADIEFHDIILQASENVFVSLLFNSFWPLLREARYQTSAVPEIQRHAIHHHATILAALKSGDEERTRIAMEQHMQQIEQDLREFVLDDPAPQDA